jgi:hypothetical protein
MGHSGRYGRFKSSRAAEYATSTTRTAASAISYLSWKSWALLLSRRPSLSPPQDWLRGEKSLDQLVNSLNHDGWWSASGSLQARQNNNAACPDVPTRSEHDKTHYREVLRALTGHEIGYRHLVAGFPSPYDDESMTRLVTEVKPSLERV